MTSLYCDQCQKHIADSSPGMEVEGRQFSYSYVMGYAGTVPQFEFCSWECMKDHIRSQVFREVPVGASS